MKIGNFFVLAFFCTIFMNFYVEILEEIIYNKNVWDDFPKNFIKNSKLMNAIMKVTACIRCSEEGYAFASMYFALIGKGDAGYTCIILKFKENLPMRKHHHFERRNTKIVLVSALAAATVCSFTACADQEALSEFPPVTTESEYVTETVQTTNAFSEQTTFVVPETTTVKTETVMEATTEQLPLETTVPADPEPIVRAEKTEEREAVPYRVVYEYSYSFYSGTRIVKQDGKDGEILRVTVTTYEDGIALDVSVTETVISDPVDKIVIMGMKDPFPYKNQTVTEDIFSYETEIRYDDSLYDDERIVLQEGVNGYSEAIYRITYDKGIEISREKISVEIFEPKNEIVAVGTKPAWTEETVTEKGNTISYRTEYVYDDTLADGTRIVKTAGKNGYTETVYTISYYRGEFSSKSVLESTVYEPVTEVIVIGTKKEESFGLPYYAGRGYPITQGYGGGHYAMDIGVWYGDPILAVKSGTVIYAYDEGDFPTSDANWTYGTFVVIEHEDGVRSYYAHLKSRTVSAGQKVKGGQVIGYSGNTGRVNPPATSANPYAGTHLHFEIRVKRNGSYVKVDPTQYIDFYE